MKAREPRPYIRMSREYPEGIMVYDPGRHHRHTIRLRNYDYAQAGVCYVTICTSHRECLFGDISNGHMERNEYGLIVENCWHDIAAHFPHVILDAFVVMPNHIHGIIVITDATPGQTANAAPDETVGAGFPRPSFASQEGEGTSPLRQKRPALGAIVAYFKYQSTKQINATRNTPSAPVWQRIYHERIARDDWMLNNARNYIENNPARWEKDENNPANVSQP